MLALNELKAQLATQLTKEFVIKDIASNLFGGFSRVLPLIIDSALDGFTLCFLMPI